MTPRCIMCELIRVQLFVLLCTQVVKTQKETITTQEATVNDLQEQIVVLNKQVDDLKQENQVAGNVYDSHDTLTLCKQELTEKATKASEAMSTTMASPAPTPTKSTPSRGGVRNGSRASLSVCKLSVIQYSDLNMLFTQSPKVVQSVGIQVGGIFLEPKVISLPTNTNTIGTQCNEEVLAPKKTERQLEHESQIQKLKSSLQMAYKVKHNIIKTFTYTLV